MGESSDRANNESQATGHGGWRGVAKVLLVTTAVGAMLGVTFCGLMEWVPALILPHGGWEHVHWNLGGEFALKGGAAGLVFGAFITIARKVF